jgi:hypothetical protein
MYRLICATLLTLSFGACSASDNGSVTMRFSPPELAQELVKELEKKNIDYTLSDDSVFTFHKTDMEKIMSLSKNIMSSILPKKRSFAPANDEMLSCYTNEFDDRDVPYEIKTVYDEKWIVLRDDNFDTFYSLCSAFK